MTPMDEDITHARLPPNNLIPAGWDVYSCDSPKSKAELLAAVSDAAATQALTYLCVVHEASWAIRHTQFNPNFTNKLWNQKFIKHIEDFQKEAILFIEEIMLCILQDCPGMIRRIEHEFEQTLQEFTAFLGNSSDPLTDHDCEVIRNYCAHLLGLCQDFPREWGKLVSEQDGRIVGLLPEWINTFGILGKIMERDVEDKHKGLTARDQFLIKDYGSAAMNIYQDTCNYYAEQPRNALAPAICVLLSAQWSPMTYLIGISPAAGGGASWTKFKSCLNKHAGAIWTTLNNGDLFSTAAVIFFSSSVRAIVCDAGLKEMIAFETLWLTYGKILKNLVGTFQINPKTKTRGELLLDLEDAVDYWAAVKDYIQSFPNFKPIEKIVKFSELP